jgi:hypothetical protein
LWKPSSQYISSPVVLSTIPTFKKTPEFESDRLNTTIIEIRSDLLIYKLLIKSKSSCFNPALTIESTVNQDVDRERLDLRINFKTIKFITGVLALIDLVVFYRVACLYQVKLYDFLFHYLMPFTSHWINVLVDYAFHLIVCLLEIEIIPSGCFRSCL